MMADTTNLNDLSGAMHSLQSNQIDSTANNLQVPSMNDVTQAGPIVSLIE